MDQQQQYQEQMDAIKDDLRDLRENLKGMMEVFKSNSKSRMSAARERLSEMARDRYEQLRDAASRGYGQARQYSRQAIARAQNTIEERPLTSVLVALGAGLLIGSLLSRRRR
jgi:ElaB/YqjD/DUF883 family membrane-anchored ribosome-binding protein